jgi:D-alanyl-D-alanine carboxypeptidase/D-alanyl-D-alanine-endopeptidase (penicillin-binding protein 4)
MSRFPRSRRSRRRPSGLLPLLLLLLLTVSLFGSTPDTAWPAAYKPPASIPEWTARLQQAIEKYGERWSVFVLDLQTGNTVYAFDSDRRLSPASCRKVVTTALALEYLGPNHQFQTVLGMDAPIEPDHTNYHGNLILRSAGNPCFGGPFQLDPRNPFDLFAQWADALVADGVSYVHGDLILDASAFGTDQNVYPSVWEARHRTYSYAPVPSAVAVCQNALTISVRPGAKSGYAAQVRVFPALQGIELNNEILTRSRGRSGISGQFDADPRTVQLRGRMNLESGQEVIILPLAQPLQYIGANLSEALQSRGVRVTGDVRIELARPAGVEPTPLIEIIGRQQSPPLNRILVSMLRRSNNFMAEQIWQATAARVTGVGDRLSARQVEQRWLGNVGLGWIEPGWDGSGLSRQTEIAARELALIMRKIHESVYRDVMIEALPRDGRQGTLRNRAFTRNGGRVQAKTGTLAGVSSLTGFVMDKEDNPRLVFAMIGNAPGDTDGRLAMRINELMKLIIEDLDAGALPGQ